MKYIVYKNTYKIHIIYIQNTYNIHMKYIVYKNTYKIHIKYIQNTYNIHTKYIQWAFNLPQQYTDRDEYREKEREIEITEDQIIQIERFECKKMKPKTTTQTNTCMCVHLLALQGYSISGTTSLTALTTMASLSRSICTSVHRLHSAAPTTSSCTSTSAASMHGSRQSDVSADPSTAHTAGICRQTL